MADIAALALPLQRIIVGYCGITLADCDSRGEIPEWAIALVDADSLRPRDALTFAEVGSIPLLRALHARAPGVFNAGVCGRAMAKACHSAAVHICEWFHATLAPEFASRYALRAFDSHNAAMCEWVLAKWPERGGEALDAIPLRHLDRIIKLGHFDFALWWLRRMPTPVARAKALDVAAAACVRLWSREAADTIVEEFKLTPDTDGFREKLGGAFVTAIMDADRKLLKWFATRFEITAEHLPARRAMLALWRAENDMSTVSLVRGLLGDSVLCWRDEWQTAFGVASSGSIWLGEALGFTKA